MPSQSITLDGNKLKEIASRNETASITANSLATRERIRHHSDIIRTRAQLVRDGQRIVDSDYMQFWKELENAGVGSLIFGRKGKPNRFAWHFSLKSIAKSMLEGTNEKVAGRTSKKLQSVEPAQQSSKQENGNMEPLTQKVTFVLSATRVVELRVPDNFTKAEADKVYAALKTLAT